MVLGLSNKMKRIVITGSAGFAGSHLVEHLLKNTDWEIIGLDSFRHRGDALRINFDPNRYKVYTHDCATPLSYRLSEKIGPIDYIINLAAESHVDRSISDPVSFIQNNVNLALYMLEYARQVKPKAYIQISTDEVYGAAPEGVDHEEWSPILPSNPYAASKAAQEAIAISYWRTYNVPLMITNTMNMFGERQDPEKYIPMLIQKIQKGEQVTIHGSEDYIGKRHYLHSRNHADALLFLLNNKTPTLYQDSPNMNLHSPMPDRYNVVGEVELDNRELALMIAQTLKKQLNYTLVDFHAARPGHDRRYSLDGRKIASLGWKAPMSFRESLDKMIYWTLDHQEWLK
jgi:dTDP-glucose 4,6-dehydratase